METLGLALASLQLLAAFWLVAGKRMHSHISAFRAQAVLLAVNVGALGVREVLATGRPDLLVVCAALVALKVVYIPRKLHRTYAAIEYRIEKDFLANIPTLVLACVALVLLVYAAVSGLGASVSATRALLLVEALSVVLVGVFFLLSRRKAIGQIVGLLVIENGLFATGLYASDGMPFIVDLGILLDLLTAVLVLGVLVLHIDDAFETTDTDRLDGLKG